MSVNVLKTISVFIFACSTSMPAPAAKSIREKVYIDNQESQNVIFNLKNTTTMKRMLLTLLLASLGMAGYSKTWVITNSGFEFSPDDLSIQLGDSVRFQLAAIHNVIEVTEADWNNNKNTQLIGGFSLPLGGGLIPADKLTEGTHFYVCGPHASSGMKGKIKVEGTTGVGNQPTASALTLFPNPSDGVFRLDFNGTASSVQLDVFDSQGRSVYGARNLEQGSIHAIDLTSLGKGLYFARISDYSGIYTRRLVIQ
jgi:plastocyanin